MVDVNCKSKIGSPLHYAVMGDQDDVINYLLRKNADLLVKDNHGNTALSLAIQLKAFNIFSLLFEFVKEDKKLKDEKKKEIMNSVNDEGNSLLHELAYSKSSSIINMINKLPVNIRTDEELKNNKGYTYKQLQENIIEAIKERELIEKKLREEIRLEKLRAIEEKKQDEELRRKQEQEEEFALHRSKEIGKKLIKYRGALFVLILALFGMFVYLILQSATKKKADIII